MSYRGMGSEKDENTAGMRFRGASHQPACASTTTTGRSSQKTFLVESNDYGDSKEREEKSLHQPLLAAGSDDDTSVGAASPTSRGGGGGDGASSRKELRASATYFADYSALFAGPGSGGGDNASEPEHSRLYCSVVENVYALLDKLPSGLANKLAPDTFAISGEMEDFSRNVFSYSNVISVPTAEVTGRRPDSLFGPSPITLPTGDRADEDRFLAVISDLAAATSPAAPPTVLAENTSAKGRMFADNPGKKRRGGLLEPYDKHNPLHAAIAKDLYRLYCNHFCVSVIGADGSLVHSTATAAAGSTQPCIAVSEADFVRHVIEPLIASSAKPSSSTQRQKDSNKETFASSGKRGFFSKTGEASSSANASFADSAAPGPSSAAPRTAAHDKDFCSISSEYWKLLGFQGVDPATDFRGGGVLSLLLLHHLFSKRPCLMSAIMNKRETVVFNPHAAASSTADAAEGAADGDLNVEQYRTRYEHEPAFYTDLRRAATAGASASAGTTAPTAPASGPANASFASIGAMRGVFLTGDYPFAIAGINIAVHLCILLGSLGAGTSVMATSLSSSAPSSTAEAAKGQYNTVGPFAARKTRHRLTAALYHAATRAASGSVSRTSHPERLVRAVIADAVFGCSAAASPAETTLVDAIHGALEALGAVFVYAVAATHNEYLNHTPPKEQNILYFNQVLGRTRPKIEAALRQVPAPTALAAPLSAPAALYDVPASVAAEFAGWWREGLTETLL